MPGRLIVGTRLCSISRFTRASSGSAPTRHAEWRGGACGPRVLGVIVVSCDHLWPVECCDAHGLAGWARSTKIAKYHQLPSCAPFLPS